MWIGLGLIMAMPLIPARAQSADRDVQQLDQKIQELQKQIDELDQRVKIAERNKELKDEEAANQAKNAAISC
jgi:cell division protein FtsL